MFKRLTALLLAASMLLSLSGCGRPKEQSAGGRSSDSEQSMDVLQAPEADTDGRTVETAPHEEYPTLVTTSVFTSDGGARTVPLLAECDSIAGDGEDGAPTDVYQSSNGYVLEYVTAEKRDLGQTARENAELYAGDFRESRGYETLVEPSHSVLSPDADAAVAGLAFRNADLKQDVTVITGCLEVQDSREMLYFDLFVYSKSVTNKEIAAIEDLMHALGVELPVEIIKN